MSNTKSTTQEAATPSVLAQVKAYLKKGMKKTASKPIGKNEFLEVFENDKGRACLVHARTFNKKNGNTIVQNLGWTVLA